MRDLDQVHELELASCVSSSLTQCIQPWFFVSRPMQLRELSAFQINTAAANTFLV